MIDEKAKQLGNYIKKLRKEKNITAKEFGGYVGYSQSYISALENNNNNNVPSKKVLRRLATAFGHIGYNSLEIEEQLFNIAGYEISKFNSFDNLNIELDKYIGAYDNLSKTTLDKPYLDLSYLLNNNFDLRFQYKYKDDDHYVSITEEQKQFIYDMVTRLLKLEGIEKQIEEEIEKLMEENDKISKEMYPFQVLEEKIERLQLDLRILNDIKRNFSEENFEYEYNNSIQVLKMIPNDNEDKIDFSKESLLKAIKYVSEQIEKLTNEYDELDKKI